MKGKIIYSFILLLFIFSCKNNLPNNVEFNPSQYPSAPKNLKVSVGDSKVLITWTQDKIENVDFFNIYRKSEMDTVFNKIGISQMLTFEDNNLKNGVLYIYSVSAVGKNGFESAKSEQVEAKPAVFSIVIQSGVKYTNTRNVILTLIAPSETAFMKISNDPQFEDAVWEPFVNTKTWLLTENDGEKIVYAKFRDQKDRESLNAVSDKIILDTKAVIKEVTENTNGRTMSAGELIHFTLNAGESGGRATINIEMEGCFQCGRQGILLYDDGTNGDNKANDGIYQRDFTIPTGLEVSEAKIVGNFTDRVGNVAEPMEATGRITIQNPPTAVTLLQPDAKKESPVLQLSWTQNFDVDFSSYKLFRSLNPDVTLQSTLVTVIENQNILNYLDRDLKENTTYYYRIFVFDKSGLFAASNEVSGTTEKNEPPDPVILAQPKQIDSTTFRITWTQSTAEDFASYQIFRSEISPVDTTQAPIGVINNNPATTFFDDTNLQKDTLYFYRVFVFDKGGLSAGSNEVKGKLK